MGPIPPSEIHSVVSHQPSISTSGNITSDPHIEAQLRIIRTERKARIKEVQQKCSIDMSNLILDIERLVSTYTLKIELGEIPDNIKLKNELDLEVGRFFKEHKQVLDDQAAIGDRLNLITMGAERSLARLQMEQLINYSINTALYQVEVCDFLKKNKEKIIKKFGVDGEEKLKLDEIGFNIKLISQETHNKGRAPVVVEFIYGGKLILKVIYKPRSAEIDFLVILVFKKLNELPKNVRSSKGLFPTYRILPFQSSSIWEYIEGKTVSQHLGNERDLTDKAIEQGRLKVGHGVITLSNDQKQALKEELLKLEQVLSAMHMTDLHGTNVIIKGVPVDEKIPQIFPIDLECREEGLKTWLFSNPEREVKEELTPAEKQIIDSFNRVANRHTSRQLPVSSQKFADVVHAPALENFDTLLQAFQIVQGGVEMFAQLKGDIINSILHGDVPYITKTGDKFESI